MSAPSHREEMIKAGRRPVARRFMTNPATIDAFMSQDIAEIFTANRCVLRTDLIRLGWTPAQVETFQSRSVL